MRPDRDWLDYLSVIVLIAAFIAAASAAQQAERLATATLEATAHSDFAARTQHADTLEALKRADDANALAKSTAERQAADTMAALNLSKASADTLRDTLNTNNAAQRAYVFFSTQGGSVPYMSNGAPINVRFYVPVTNSGNTTTRCGTITFACKPSDVSYDDPWILLSQPGSITKSVFVAPHETIQIGCTFDIDKVTEIKNGSKFAYLVMKMAYRDRLTPSITRISEGEFQIRVSDIYPTVISTISYIGAHNCTDEDCPDYDEPHDKACP